MPCVPSEGKQCTVKKKHVTPDCCRVVITNYHTTVGEGQESIPVASILHEHLTDVALYVESRASNEIHFLNTPIPPLAENVLI